MRELEPRLEVWRGLLYGQRAMLLSLVTRLKREFDLTASQYEALISLQEAPERTMTATELATLLLYSSGSTTHLVARLEERGLVTRRKGDADQRVVFISLTDEGEDLINRATDKHIADLNEVFVPLISDEETPVLLDFARRLAAVEGVRSHPPRAD